MSIDEKYANSQQALQCSTPFDRSQEERERLKDMCDRARLVGGFQCEGGGNKWHATVPGLGAEMQ